MADVFNMRDRWDNVAQKWTALKMDATDTASAANSLLLDLQVDGATKFSVDKYGNLFSATGPIGGGGSGGSDTYTPPSGLPRLIDGKLDEYVSLTDFVLSSEPDHSLAWARFGVWARGQSAAGKGVELYLPPGLWTFNHAQVWAALEGIRRLHIKGYGASVKNLYDPGISGAQFGYEMQWFAVAGGTGNVGFQINTTLYGATTATLKTPAEHSNFAVGNWVWIGSVDIQGYGQPPNVDRFDFTQITAINTSTGEITFFPPLKNEHRDDFPDWNIQADAKWGKARIYQLTSDTSWAVGNPAYDYLEPPFEVMWDIDHHYEGFEIRQITNSTYPYLPGVSGRNRSFINMKLPAFSEGSLGHVRGESCLFNGMGETDKLIDSMEFDSCVWDSSVIYQSSSVNSVSLKNCKAPYVGSGNVKSFYAQNCDFDSYTAGAYYGHPRRQVLVGCRIGGLGDFYPYPINKAFLISIDVTNISYANGTFRQLKSSSNPIFNMQPGQAGYWVATAFVGYSGDLGSFYITGIRDDATYIYIDTTCPFAATPSWALSGGNAQIAINRTGNASFIECWGGDGTNRLTEATRKGERHGEYYKDIYMGAWAGTGYWQGRVGVLKRVVINVRQASAVAAGIQFELGAGNATTLVPADDLPFIIYTDTSVKGKRDYTLAALTGKVGGDAVTLGGVAQTTLPANRISGLGYWYGISTSGLSAHQMAVVEVEWYFDGGMYLTPLVAQAAHQGSFNIAGVVGTIHP